MPENQRIWDMLPELDAFNFVGQAKPDATVLGISVAVWTTDQPCPYWPCNGLGKDGR
jgi:hypothetical protein